MGTGNKISEAAACRLLLTNLHEEMHGRHLFDVRANSEKRQQKVMSEQVTIFAIGANVCVKSIPYC